MSVTKIFVLLIMLVLPICTALVGCMRYTKCTNVNDKRAYRSERACVSPASWAFAQKACGIRYMIGGMLMAVASVLLTLILPEMPNPMPMYVYGGVFAVLWIVLNLVLMVLTEVAIMGQHFEKT